MGKNEVTEEKQQISLSASQLFSSTPNTTTSNTATSFAPENGEIVDNSATTNVGEKEIEEKQLTTSEAAIVKPEVDANASSAAAFFGDVTESSFSVKGNANEDDDPLPPPPLTFDSIAETSNNHDNSDSFLSPPPIVMDSLVSVNPTNDTNENDPFLSQPPTVASSVGITENSSDRNSG